MKDDYTHITVVIDKSGSMKTCASDTVGGFNQFVNDQKEAAGKATLTLVQFDTEYVVTHQGLDIQKVPGLKFNPGGNTALLDALGRSIMMTGDWLSAMAEEERPKNVVIVVMTDGHENASKEFNKDQIKQMVDHQTNAYQWHFVFLGANMDAIAEGGAVGVAAAASANYVPTKQREAYDVVSKNLQNVRSGKSRSMAFTDNDRKRLI